MNWAERLAEGFEELLRRELGSLREARESVSKYNTYTLWLEFFAYAIGVQANEIIKSLDSKQLKTEVPSVFFEINDRQKKILSLLEKPGSKISNEDVQKGAHWAWKQLFTVWPNNEVGNAYQNSHSQQSSEQSYQVKIESGSFRDYIRHWN